MLKYVVVLSVFAALNVALAGPIIDDLQDESKISNISYRLPTKVVPEEYRIRIAPNLDELDPEKKFSFQGRVEIDVRASLFNVKEIVLHSKGLKLMWPEMTNRTIVDVVEEEDYEFVRLTLNDSMAFRQIYTLSFDFEGYMRDDMTGFYKSSYQEGNVTKWLGATQFQTIHARKAFPCFDEPEFKAVFKLAIDCPEGYSCISNMKEKERINETIFFEDTPKMSTYLVAFMVSKLERIPSLVDENFAIWSRPEVAVQSQYALDIGVQLLKEMENFTSIGYYDMGLTNSTMKLDHVAVPDFSSGAMENWGLIKYREPYLMMDPNETATKYKRRIVTLMGHEIAHQWFGNMITCEWWSEAWLNEGFATYLEYLIGNKVAPDYHLDELFVTDQLHSSLAADITVNYPPLWNPDVNTPDEITRQLGTVAYNKGASIIRMMEHWLDYETLKKGLFYHLTDANQYYRTVIQDDLFKALQKAADETGSISNYNVTVKRVFDSWTVKSGYPVLEVSMDMNDHSINLIQKRFLQKDEKQTKDLYHIPITYVTETNPDFENTKPLFVMSKESIKLENMLHEWIIFNIQQTGYYRVFYDHELYDLIIKALTVDKDKNQIHESNKAQLVDDAFSFAKEGKIKYGRMFEIIQFLENETDFSPWIAAYSGINYLRPRFETLENLSNDFEMHILRLMNNTIYELGLDHMDNNESNYKKTFRTQTMVLACAMGNGLCKNKSIELFEDWKNNNTLAPDYREFVYCNGLRHGESSDFDLLWSKYIDEKVVNEKYIIMGALGCTKKEEKLKYYLTRSIEIVGPIRGQDRMAVFNSALNGNKNNVRVVWEFMKANIIRIRQTHGARAVPGMLNNIAMKMSSEDLIEFKNFMSSNEEVFTDSEKQSALKSVESAEKSLEWVKSVEDDIRNWIKAKYNSAGALGASLTLLMTMLIVLFSN